MGLHVVLYIDDIVITRLCSCLEPTHVGPVVHNVHIIDFLLYVVKGNSGICLLLLALCLKHELLDE